MSEMSASEPPSVNVTVFKSQKDLPSDVLWQEVCEQLVRAFHDLDRSDLIKSIQACVNPDAGAILWRGEVSTDLPSVQIEIHGPIEEAPDRRWTCDIRFFPGEAGWQLTDSSQNAFLMSGIRLTSLRDYIEDLNNKPNLPTESRTFQIGGQ